MDPKAQKLRIIGYCCSGYKLWDEEQCKLVIGRNVVFDKSPKTINKEENYDNRNISGEKSQEEKKCELKDCKY